MLQAERPRFVYQPSLLTASAVGGAEDLDFGQARRILLDARSWIEHIPNWLSEPDALFAELIETAPWLQRDRWMYTRQVSEPRLTADFPDVAQVPLKGLRDIAAALSERFGVRYRSLWVNLYRNQHDSTAWHGDNIGRIQARSIVPVLTLGATRRFLIRPTSGGSAWTFRPASGDLIVMGGRAQRDWRHCVPKESTPSGPRISINFAPERHTELRGIGRVD
ncbi:MAG TPA: alpha-ketoglutarate-dependent dioxygenase AlkB [Chloroflexota bacterium]|nr:alpha-ketoglutarate-dependent dioxygenase AlkB [Chloroflexota bacterium]